VAGRAGRGQTVPRARTRRRAEPPTGRPGRHGAYDDDVSRVLLIRHGETQWNAERRWQGWRDSPLTAAAEAQAATRAAGLAAAGFAPRALWSSDLGRARRTAEIVAAHLEVPVLADAGFREKCGGDWEGYTADEIDTHWPGMRERWRRGEIAAMPGGEDDATVLARFDDALRRVLDHVGDGVFGIVMHGGILRLVATRAGADVHTLIPNLGGFWFDVTGGALCAPRPLDTARDDATYERPGIE